MFQSIRCLLALLALLLVSGAVCAQTAAPPRTLDAPTAATKSEPSLDDLIGILEDDTSRQKLIESLKAAAYSAPKGSDEATDAQAGATESASVPARIARYSQLAIGTGIAIARRGIEAVSDARHLLSGANRIDLPRIVDAILPVVLVALVVMALYTAGRFDKRPLFSRIARRAGTRGPLARLVLLVAVGLVDMVQILVGAAGGYVAAIVFFGGPPNLNQALFLNAFVVIEVVRALFDMLVSPRYSSLRLTPFSDTQALFWHRWLSRIISLVGYTFLFVAPLVGTSSSAAAGDAVRLLVATVALVLVVMLIVRQRATVSERLGRSFHAGDRRFGARAQMLFGRIWWIVALGFVVSLYAVWLNSPSDGLRWMASATVQSVAAMLVGGLIASVLARLIAAGVRVPERVKERLPLIERRVNAFIPAALAILRFVVLAIVVAVIVEAWEIFDFRSWVETGFGQRVVSGAIGAGVVICLGFLVFLGVSSFVEYRLNPNYGTVPTARERTLLALFRNGFTITLLVIVAMLVLSQIGIDIGPLLAGAGVVGLAVGFGAQKLVQDIITGAFIQLENAMNEGDIVKVGSTTGTVERLTIRSVALRSVDGSYHLIPFSSVDQVSNLSKDFSRCVADIGVAYREDVGEVKDLMKQAFEELKTGDQGSNVTGEFEMFGLQELGTSQVTVRGRMTTKPGKQWAVGRAYNEVVKRMFDDRGVELPFPQTTVWFGEDKTGRAPAMHIRNDGKRETTTLALPGRLEAEGATVRPQTPTGRPIEQDSGDSREDGDPQ